MVLLKAYTALAVLVLVLSFILAVGHAPLALGISFLFRQSGRPPPPQPGRAGPPPFPFFGIGAYFLFATVVYILGGIFVASGKLFKLANISLIVLAIVDNLLLIYTRTMPNIFFGRVIPWSTGWFPIGTVQILIGQTILIVLCAILYKTKSSPTK